ADIDSERKRGRHGSVLNGPGQSLARISHTVAGAGSVLAAPKALRALPIQPVSAAARKPPLIPWGTTMPSAIIQQPCEKSGLGGRRSLVKKRPGQQRARSRNGPATTG